MFGLSAKKALVCTLLPLVLLGAALGADAQTRRQDYNRDVIYQIVTDRFYDGDANNNNPSQSAGLYDSTKTNWGKYWGGDLAGITAKMVYLKDMGVTAIWISPPLDNRNVVATGGSTAPYHGYEMRDTQMIEEHFGDSSNTWTAFDTMVSTAHANGIKVIVDFAPNHSNIRGSGEDGRLAANGALLATYGTDTNGFFHKPAPNISGSQWDDPYYAEYYTIYDLADLNPENSQVDSALKDSVKTLQQHGVDGFRIDATKHVTWGWEYSLANSIYTYASSFCFGEWVADDTSNPLYASMVKFTNKSGISEINFPLYNGVTNVFAYNHAFTELDAIVGQQTTDFSWQNDLVNFVDNHDRARLLSLNNNANRLYEAMSFVLTARGIPCIYYGDEQSLHNDTGGGGDPYNRPMMASFDETTTGFKTVQKLSTLRKDNAALAYGGTQQRWINSDVYIYERKFFNNVVVVAINKNDTAAANITNLVTSLPTGTYTDYLGGLLGGVSLTATSATGGGYNTVNFSLPAHGVAVWQINPTTSTPQVGALEPTVAQPGVTVNVTGCGFGTSTGTVKFGTTTATITSWGDKQIVCRVPTVANGTYGVTVTRAGGGAASNAINATVLQAKLIPVTFTVYSAYTNPGDTVYLTGNTVELGSWSTSAQIIPGPLNNPNYPTWFLNVSVPAGATIQFKFIKILSNGSVVWEGQSNHSYTVPTSGTGFVNVTWQN